MLVVILACFLTYCEAHSRRSGTFGEFCCQLHPIILVLIAGDYGHSVTRLMTCTPRIRTIYQSGGFE